MRILIVTEVIVAAGAEGFVLRLARSLRQKGHDVSLFIFYEHFSDKSLAAPITDEVEIIYPHIPFVSLARKLDGLLLKLKIDYSLRGSYIKRVLKRKVRKGRFDLLHSHLLKADIVCTDVGREMNVPVMSTIHGDYLQYYDKIQNKVPIRLLHYFSKARRVLTQMQKIVCISDQQIDFLRQKFPVETKDKLAKIYNGYSATQPKGTDDLRKRLSIPQDAFVFGMVSRGIQSKGWSVAIEAFEQMKDANAHLVLVGAGDYLDQIKDRYSNNKNIHFTGKTNEPLEWIAAFDVAMLPSTADSLPTVIIEYMCCGKPVIASDVGEIPRMLGVGGYQAGVVVPIEAGKVPVSKVTDAMRRLMTDTEYYNTCQQSAAACLAQFDMEKCVSAYEQVYASAADIHKG